MSEQLLLKIINKLEVVGATVDSVDSRLGKIEKRLDALENDKHELKMTVLRTENDLGKKASASLDAWKQADEKLDRIMNQLDRIENKVTSHDIQISILDKTKSNRRIVKAK